MTSNTNKVLNNSFWNILNTILTFASGILLSVFIARFLGPEKTGTYNYFLWLISIFVLITSLGGNAAIIKYVAEFASKREFKKAGYFIKKILFYQLIFTVILCALIIILNDAFGLFTKSHDTKNYLYIILLSLFPFLLISSFSSIIAGVQKYKSITRVNIFLSIITIPLILTVLFTTGSVRLLLITNLLILSLSSVIYFLHIKDYLLKPGLKIPSIKFKEIINYSGSIYLVTLLDAVIWQKSEIFFLGFFSQSSQIAYYAVAYGLANMIILMIAGSFSSALVPVYSRLKVLKEDFRIKSGYFRTTKLLSIVVIPAATGLLILSPKLVAIIYGPSYSPASLLFNILIIPMALAAIAGSGSALIYSLNKQGFIIRWGIPLALLNICLDLILIPRFNATGAAIANSVTQILGLSIGTFYIIYVLKMSFPLFAFFKVIFASGIMALSLFAISGLNLNIFLNLSVSLITGSLIYFISIIYLRTFDRIDMEMLKSLDHKLIKNPLALKFFSYLEGKIK